MKDPNEFDKIELNLQDFPWTHDLEIPNYRGIYFIFDKSDSLIYIGLSKNIRNRICIHRRGEGCSSWFKEFANSIACIEYKGNLYKRELKYILKYNPKFNKESLNYDNSYSRSAIFNKIINQEIEQRYIKEGK